MNNLARLRPTALIGEVCSHDDLRWTRLHQQIQEYSLKTGQFKLASGRESTFLFQLRQTTLHPEGAFLLSDIIVDYMAMHKIRFIGGLVLGAVPIAASVAAVSFARKAIPPIHAFFVRKEAKGHGAKEIIDGFTGGEPADEILLVDDVATSGGSLLKALHILQEQGFKGNVTKALVIVDREEGATENLAKEGIELVSIFKKSDFAIPQA